MRDKPSAAERRAARTAKVIADMKAKRAKVAKPTRARSPLQFVYFARSLQFIKIGWATSIETRMNNLRIGNPHPVELLVLMMGGPHEEGALHAHFWNWHHRGEWFVSNPELQHLIDQLMPLDPVDARVEMGRWFSKTTGSTGMLLFDKGAETLRKRESAIANVR